MGRAPRGLTSSLLGGPYSSNPGASVPVPESSQVLSSRRPGVPAAGGNRVLSRRPGVPLARRTSAGAASILALTIALTSCGKPDTATSSNQPTAAAQSIASARPSSTAGATRHPGAIPAVQPGSHQTSTVPTTAPPAPTPPFSCSGAVDYDAVQYLVFGGQASLLIDATVTGEPTMSSEVTATVPVAEVKVLAGSESTGPLTAVNEPKYDEVNLLPPGRYLMLLRADADRDPVYSLTGGLQGTFLVDGDQATQRCPNYDHPGDTLYAQRSIPVQDLVTNIARAIDDYPKHLDPSGG